MERTYKDLKRIHGRALFVYATESLERTYKDLKLLGTGLEQHVARRLERTYKDLKPKELDWLLKKKLIVWSVPTRI